MNREQRRHPEKFKGNVEKLEAPVLDEKGKEFIDYAEETSVNLNAFFKMFSFWLSLSSSQKQAVIVECVKQGKIDLEEGKNAEQGSEGE